MLLFYSTTGDSLHSVHDGKAFSTWDADYDPSEDAHCAQTSHGGWWYSKCYQSNLNGRYNSKNREGMKWWSWGKTLDKYMSSTRIMMRPVP